MDLLRALEKGLKVCEIAFTLEVKSVFLLGNYLLHYAVETATRWRSELQVGGPCEISSFLHLK